MGAGRGREKEVFLSLIIQAQIKAAGSAVTLYQLWITKGMFVQSPWRQQSENILSVAILGGKDGKSCLK